MGQNVKLKKKKKYSIEVHLIKWVKVSSFHLAELGLLPPTATTMTMMFNILIKGLLYIVAHKKVPQILGKNKPSARLLGQNI